MSGAVPRNVSGFEVRDGSHLQPDELVAGDPEHFWYRVGVTLSAPIALPGSVTELDRNGLGSQRRSAALSIVPMS